jgi:hypothetical protein
MTRLFVMSALALGLLAAACSAKQPVDEGTGDGSGGSEADSGGSGPGAKGGSGGSRSGGTGGTKPDGSGGTASGGTVGNGGNGGSDTGTGGSSSGGTSAGGSGGTTADSGTEPADGPAQDGPAADAGTGTDGFYNPGGDPWPGGTRPYIHLCKPEWNQTQCCEFLCTCVNHLCTDSPKDQSYIPNCMSMCSKLGFPRARCQVFHCFESQSPTAVKDHESHCGHATGRVGGGSCTGVP